MTANLMSIVRVAPVLGAALLVGCASAPRTQTMAAAPAAQSEAGTAGLLPSVAALVAPTAAKADNPLLTPPEDLHSSAPEPAPKLAEPVAQKTAAPTIRDARPAVLSQTEADIDRVSDRINRITTLKAEFTQIDGQGLNQGRFYLSRPGKVRFEYENPGAPLVVADGNRVVVHDRKMDTYSRAKIEETPLRLLLLPGIDLRRDAKVTQIQREDGLLMLSAEETEGYGQGFITFIFSEPTLELLRWIVTDPMGGQTTVTLRNTQAGMALDPDLFKTPSDGIMFGGQ